MTMRQHPFSLAVAMATVFAAVGCGNVSDVELVASGESGEIPSFKEFLARVYQEPKHGLFIVEDDMPFLSMEELREYYDSVYLDNFLNKGNALAIVQHNDEDSYWRPEAKRNLTYCVNQNTFGQDYNAVVAAMNTAAARWEKYVDVNFIHRSEHDSNCGSHNDNVIFDVEPSLDSSWSAQAFWPHYRRSIRVLYVSRLVIESSTPLANILTHELGHVLGFVHEHARIPQSDEKCIENPVYRELTPYDAYSVMNYDFCGGLGALAFLTTWDAQGAQAIYGAPPDPPPPPRVRKTFLGCQYYTPRYLVRWSSKVPVTTFDADYWPGGGSWKSLYNGSRTSKPLNTSSGVRYYVRVRACNAYGCGGFASTSMRRDCFDDPPLPD